MNANLKGDLEWPGFITSDWAAVVRSNYCSFARRDQRSRARRVCAAAAESSPTPLHTQHTHPLSAYPSILSPTSFHSPHLQHDDGYQNAGLDMDQPGTDGWFDPSHLTTNLTTLDDMATRVIGALIAVDAFDHPVCVPTGKGECDHFLYEANASTPEHTALARTLAANGAVLLKNKGGVLPLKGGQKIAVVGDACDAPYNMASLRAWNAGNYYVMGGSGRVINPASTSILTGLKARAASATPPATITSDVNGADVIVTCGATWSSEGNDRSTLKVDQDADISGVVTAAVKAGTPVVVLLTAPGSLVTKSFDAAADAIVTMFLAGQVTGLAWADVLFGDVNPNGKLPVTFPVSESDVVEPCKETNCVYSEGLAVGYRALDGKAVSFPFGHGLSYTKFAYSAVNILTNDSTADCKAAICIDVHVKNVGEVAGAEVAQLYLTYPLSASEPGSPLKGFKKTFVLAPNASEAVRFELLDEDVSVWSSVSHSFEVVRGEFIAHVGSSSRDWRVNNTFIPK